jgi:hypothetical protein
VPGPAGPFPHERLRLDTVPGRLLPGVGQPPGARVTGRLLRHLLTDVLGSGHRLDGVVVGFRRHSGELFSVTVANNRIHERVLREGRADRRRGRRRRTRGDATVIDLAERRSRRR